MIKLDSLSRWQALAKGSVMTLSGNAPRRIRLNVNCPTIARFYTVDDHGEAVFLATAKRRDVIEFAAGGDIRITTEDEDVFVYTAENEPTFTIIENAEVFTTIADRQARNPDLEHMMFLMEQNMQKRLGQMAQEVNYQVERAYEAGKRTIAHSDAPGTAAPEPLATAPKRDDDGRAPDEPAPSAQSPAPAGSPGDGPSVSNAGDDGSDVHGKSALP